MKKILTLLITTVLICVSSSMIMAAAPTNSYDLNVDYVVGIRNFNEGPSTENALAQGVVFDGVAYLGKVVLGAEYNLWGSAAGTLHPESSDSMFALKGGMLLYDDQTSKISALALYYSHNLSYTKESTDFNETINGFGLGGLLKTQLTEVLSLDGYLNTIFGGQYKRDTNITVSTTNWGLLYGVKLNYEIPIVDNKALQLSAGFRSLMEFHSDPPGTLDHPEGQNYYNALYLFTIGGGFVF